MRPGFPLDEEIVNVPRASFSGDDLGVLAKNGPHNGCCSCTRPALECVRTELRRSHFSGSAPSQPQREIGGADQSRTRVESHSDLDALHHIGEARLVAKATHEAAVLQHGQQLGCNSTGHEHPTHS